MTLANQKSRFEFTGGNLCLDFTNTVSNRRSDHPEDLLGDYADLLAWGFEAGAISAKTMERLHARAADIPGHAQTALHSAIQVRDALYTIFTAATERRQISGASLAALNLALQEASEHARLMYTGRRFKWEWVLPEEHLNSVLWPVARAAADLLTSDDLALVRQCASSDCTWLFLDKTKNHRRRWCEMRTCGNRDKARRYYARKKA